MMRIYFKIGTPYVFANNVPDETVSMIKENSGFYKGVDVRVDPVRNYADGFRSTLKINSGKALGGELNVFAEDAIWLRERSVLEVVDNAKISEVTRGVFADDTSTIKVTAAGNVFEIGSVLTLSGCVTKVGPGALALTRVAAKGDAKPVLKVDEGPLVAAGKDAIKGVKLQFAEAAALEFNIDGDAALLASGLDVSDCEIEHADGKLAVFCKTAGEMQSAEKKTIALFSGSAAAVANLSGRIDVKLVDSQNRTRRANLELADSPVEGEKILMASFEKRGMIIHFR
jgi:hypothetical protein